MFVGQTNERRCEIGLLYQITKGGDDPLVLLRACGLVQNWWTSFAQTIGPAHSDSVRLDAFFNLAYLSLFPEAQVDFKG